MAGCAKCGGVVVAVPSVMLAPASASCLNCGWVAGTRAPVMVVSERMVAIRKAVREAVILGER